MENKLIFLSDDTDVLIEISKKFQKRIKTTDGVDLAIYKILDILVDNAMLMIDVIDESLESLEDDILIDEVDEENIQKNLDISRDVDILIRTSGEIRLSNFLLCQCAYAEMFFTNTLWPDFTAEELDKIIKAFHLRERRFGGI